MSVKVTSNSQDILRSARQKFSLFLRLIEDEIIVESTPKTPKRKGNLRQDILKQVLGMSGKIKWGKNYAAKQETTQYRNYTTPGTGPHFAKNAVESVAKNLTEAILRKVGEL